MSIDSLSLPVDIPWSRLCVSEDMLDLQVGNRASPQRWRSSIAIFSYEPPASDQIDPDTVTSYLKISCTITGFQFDPHELGETFFKDRPFSTGLDLLFNDIEHQSFGCFGAILEVAIAPTDAELAKNSNNYPFFTDFASYDESWMLVDRMVTDPPQFGIPSIIW
jgi:hypothetical protein